MAKIRWDGDAASLVAAQKAIENSTKKITEGLEKATRGAAAMERAATRIKEAIDPQAKYNNEVRRLGELVARNKLTTDQATAALAKFTQENAKGTEAGKRRWKEQADAIAAAAKQQQAMNAQGAAIKQSLETPLESYKRKLLELGKVYRAGGVDQATFVRGARQLKEELNSAGTAGGKAFGEKAIGQVTSYLAGVVSVSGAISLIKSEFQDIVRIAEQVNRAKLSAAEGDLSLRKNIFAMPAAEQDRMFAAVPRISNESNIPQGAISQAMAGTISATGKTDLSIKLVDIAARFTRKAEEVETFAGGLGDVIQTTNIRDPLDALGFITLSQAEARLTNPTKVAENLSKVTAAWTSPAAKGTPAKAGAIFAALTKGAADPSGELTRTAEVRLISQMGEFFKKEGGFKKDQIDTIDKQADILLSNPKLARKFIDGAKGFRAATKGAVERLFLGDPLASDAYNSAFAKLSDPKQRIAAANKALDFVKAGELQTASRSESTVGTGVETYDIGREFSFSTEKRDKFGSLLKRAQNGSSFGNWLGLLLGTGPTLERPEAIDVGKRVISQFNQMDNPGTSITSDQREAIDALKTMVEKLTSIEAESKELNGKKGAKKSTTTAAKAKPANP